MNKKGFHVFAIVIKIYRALITGNIKAVVRAVTVNPYRQKSRLQ